VGFVSLSETRSRATTWLVFGSILRTSWPTSNPHRLPNPVDMSSMSSGMCAVTLPVSGSSRKTPLVSSHNQIEPNADMAEPPSPVPPWPLRTTWDVFVAASTRVSCPLRIGSQAAPAVNTGVSESAARLNSATTSGAAAVTSADDVSVGEVLSAALAVAVTGVLEDVSALSVQPVNKARKSTAAAGTFQAFVMFQNPFLGQGTRFSLWAPSPRPGAPRPVVMQSVRA
jgi:hypothetical protein